MIESGFYDLEPFDEMIRRVEDGDVYFLTRQGSVKAAVLPIAVYEELRAMVRTARLYERIQPLPVEEEKLPHSVGGVLDDIQVYLRNVSGKGRWTSEEYRKVYLSSPHWKARRLQVLGKRGRSCQKCGTTMGTIDVHHLSYDRIGDELDEDLAVMCRPCHEAEHVD